jgi:hypothetical protein
MKTQVMKASSAIAFIAALLLSACGGGGGGGGTDTGASTQASSTVTSANAPDVAANAFAAAGIINGQATGSPMLIASTSTEASGGTASKGVIDVTLRQIHKVLDAKSAGRLSIGATASEQTQSACTTSGTITYTITEAVSGTVSDGDSITMTANNCVEDTIKMNGSLSVEFGNISGTPSSTSAWGATLKVSYINFTVSTVDGTDSVAIHGGMTISVSQLSSTNISYTISGTSFTVTVTSEGTTTSETLGAFTYSGSYVSGVYTYGANFTMSGTFPELGNVSYVVTTNTPFKALDGYYPYQGSMTVTATNKSSLRLNVIDSINVQIQIDKNGDGVYEETTITTWDALASRV